MAAVRVTSNVAEIDVPTAVALGNFDGLHLGHQAVIAALSQAPKHCVASVVTFTPHPQAFFSGSPRPCLTLPQEKVPVLAGLGIQQLIRLPFTPALAQLSPEDFVQQILVNQLQAQFIAVGFNFGFGHRRAGTATDLQTLAGAWGIPVQIVAPQRLGSERISSSAIRQALTVGDVHLAEKLLGRPYLISGTVVTGQKLGRQLGFPTANLGLATEKFLPRFGVYRVLVMGTSLPKPWPGILNVGVRPTLGGKAVSAEVHLLEWRGDLYGDVLEVALLDFVRPERQFANLGELQSQIAADCHQALQLSLGVNSIT